MSGWLVPAPPEELRPLPRPPTFSIVIAAYQAAGVIGRALSSALEQVPPPLEVIVCDDGSTDELDVALTPFLEHITIVRQVNKGEGAAKNAAVRAARGDFVVVLDADDVFLPGRLAALGELARARPDLDLLTTDAYLTVNDVRRGRYYGQCANFCVVDQELEILRANFVFGLAAARRERLLAVGGFDESLRFTADWSGWIRMIVTGSRVGLVDEPLATYTRHDASLSADRVAMARGRIENLQAVTTELRLNTEQRQLVQALVAGTERSIPWEQLMDALVRRSPEARSRAWALLRDGNRSRSERLFAAAAAAAPSTVGALRTWAGATPCGEPRRIIDAITDAMASRRREDGGSIEQLRSPS